MHNRTVAHAPAACCAVAFLLMASSFQAAAHGDLHERIQALSASLKEDGFTNANLFLERGELFRLHEEWTNAVADFRSALRLNGSLEMANLGLGRSLLSAAHPEEALRPLNAFLAVHPDSSDGLLARAHACNALGRTEAALADYETILAKTAKPSPDIYLEKADLLVRCQRHAEALKALDGGLATLGPLAALENRAIEIEEQRGNFPAALRRLDAQIRRTPRKEFLLCRRGSILEKTGRSSEAREAYDAAAAALGSLPPERQGAPAVVHLAADIKLALARLSNSSNHHRASGL